MIDETFLKLLVDLEDRNPNHRIATVERLSEMGSRLSDFQKGVALEELRKLETDRATNEYEYGSRQSDEIEPTLRVCDVATDAILKLEATNNA